MYDENQILTMYNNGMTISEIAELLNASRRAVHTILSEIPQDKKRSRKRVGDKHPQSKLSAKERELVITLYLTGNYSYEQLGVRFGVSKSHIYNIVSRKK